MMSTFFTVTVNDSVTEPRSSSLRVTNTVKMPSCAKAWLELKVPAVGTPGEPGVVMVAVPVLKGGASPQSIEKGKDSVVSDVSNPRPGKVAATLRGGG